MPVSAAELLQRLRGLRQLALARGQHHAPMSGRELRRSQLARKLFVALTHRSQFSKIGDQMHHLYCPGQPRVTADRIAPEQGLVQKQFPRSDYWVEAWSWRA